MSKTIFTIIIFFCVSSVAIAQDTIISKTGQLNEVTVTTNKFEQKQNETGKVISIISSDEIKNSGGKSLGEILNNQPGITIGGAGGPLGTNQSVYLRGAADNYTIILLDGVPVYDPSQIANHFDLNLIPLSIIDHIEIMRGGASTLYGSGAVAGVINIITKKNSSKPFHFTAGAKAGSYNTFEEQAGVSGRKNKMSYNINFDQADSKGFSSALDTSGKSGFDKDGYHRSTANASFGIQATPALQLHPFFLYTHEKGGLDADAFIDDKDYNYNTNNLQTGLRAKYQLANKGAIHFIYSYNYVQRNYLNDSIDHSSYLQTNNYSNIQNAEAYINYKIGRKWELLAGTDYRFNKINQHSLSISVYGPYQSDLSPDSTRMNISSMYASVFFNDTSGFNIEAGGRWTHHSLYGSNATFTFNPFYLIKEKQKIFVNISSAFNAPSLYQLFTPYYGNLSLQPEQSISYEAGTDLFFSANFEMRITAFARNIKHVITFTNHYENFDKQKDKGGEIEITYSPIPALKIKGYYAFVSGKIITQNSATKLDTAYYNLFKRPKNSAGISLAYQITPALFVQLQSKYEGKRLDIFFNNTTFAQEQLWLKNYALLDFYVAYNHHQKITLFADLKNITNACYVETTGYATRGFNFTTGILFNL